MEDHIQIGRKNKPGKDPSIPDPKPLFEMNPEKLEKAPKHTIILFELPLSDDCESRRG
nr:hypothetical protein [Peribacillus frigoritolerans]